MSRVLVTGADGFIGSHLVEYLVSRGHDVRAFVLYNSFGTLGWLDESPDKVKSSIDVVAGDVRDPRSVRDAMRGCDVVIHLAALIAIPYSYRAPHSYVETNIVGTLNVLEAARDLELTRVLHTSTSEVYGTAQYVPINENHPLVGQSPYSASKIAADQIAFSFYSSFDVPVVIVRPFNTYGPRQSARAVIPTVISQILSGCKRVRLGALSPTRDFNYVKDTVRAFETIASSKVGLGQTYNVGSKYEISIGDTVKEIINIMGASVEIDTDPHRLRPKNSEVERLFADNTRVTSEFDWSPEYSGVDGLRRGLGETIDWFSSTASDAKCFADRYVL